MVPSIRRRTVKYIFEGNIKWSLIKY
jgi:hypothetical protein